MSKGSFSSFFIVALLVFFSFLLVEGTPSSTVWSIITLIFLSLFFATRVDRLGKLTTQAVPAKIFAYGAVAIYICSLFLMFVRYSTHPLPNILIIAVACTFLAGFLYFAKIPPGYYKPPEVDEFHNPGEV
mgnify:CR=1 FL=1